MSFFQYISQDTKGSSKQNGNDFELEQPKKSSFIKDLVPTKEKRSKTPIVKNNEKIDVAIESHSGNPDIIFIDKQIRKNLIDRYKLIPDLENRLKNMLWIINNSEDMLDIKKAKEDVIMLRKKIQDIETCFELSLYMLRTSDILEEYEKLTNDMKNTSFIRTFSSRDDSKIYRKNELLLNFLRIAKDYTNLNNYKQKINKPVCESCYSSKFISVEEGDSAILCESCGAVFEQLDEAPTFKDSERVNMSSRYTYTCRGHFVEAMNRFEGKQNTNIDEDIVQMLKKEVLLHRLTPETATKDHIYMFMSEKKLSDYYADINLIYYKITSKNPPDITKYRNELLEMHDQLEEAYMEVKDEERLNSLNVNWKLYKLLQLLGYECKKDDFFCLKTPLKQSEHEQKWYDMIEYLKERYPNAVTSHGNKRWRHVRTL